MSGPLVSGYGSAVLSTQEPPFDQMLAVAATVCVRDIAKFSSDQAGQWAVTAVVGVAKSFFSVPHCLSDTQ